MRQQPNFTSSLLRKSIATNAILALLTILSGCDDHFSSDTKNMDSRSQNAESNVAIAFVGTGTDDPLWKILKRSAEHYAATLGNTKVHFVNPAGPTPQDQIECLNTLAIPDLRGICVRISDTAALTPALNRLVLSGIVVVSMIEPAPQGLRAGHVGFDDTAIGTALADAVAEALGGTGSIALLHTGYSHAIYGPRQIALEKRLRFHRKLDVFNSFDCKADPELARQIIRDYTRRFPRLKAWVAIDDWPLRDIGNRVPVPPGCKLITFGARPRQWPLIQNGISDPAVAVDYGKFGACAMKFCELAIWQASRHESRYTAPLRIVRADNLDAFKRDWTDWTTGKLNERLFSIDAPDDFQSAPLTTNASP